uniref:ATP synthase subunit delta n=1 Tax=Membranoptera platyphylla TaxID=1204437 RepID=A0A1I9KQS1_9FLOR|nr:ATP synthase subunit delta [Membranoptera platyphylla]AMJ16976.1 ATP synthase subunit delta [Membranoptera platyphylla]
MSSNNILDKISIPYAEALLGLAKDNNFISEAEQNLLFISTTLSNSRDLQLFLANPLINVVVKKKVINTLFKGNINDFILNFLLVLIDRRRIPLLITIINKYLELTYRLNAIIIVELFSSIEFSETQQGVLIETIKNITNSRNVKLVMTVDSNLIGGFILKIGSKVIDASLAGKLRKISFYLNAS